MVYNAERVNSLLARHWRSFATQNYFDEHGVFFCALVSTPLLLDMFVILVRLAVCGTCSSYRMISPAYLGLVLQRKIQISMVHESKLESGC